MARSKTNQMTEHALSAKLRKKLNTMPGVFAFKIHGGSMQAAGLPDWCILFSKYTGDWHTAVTMFVELKSPRGSGMLTKLQSTTHKKMDNAGHPVIVATSVEQVVEQMKVSGYDPEL